jgi:hypothetical protein
MFLDHPTRFLSLYEIQSPGALPPGRCDPATATPRSFTAPHTDQGFDFRQGHRLAEHDPILPVATVHEPVSPLGNVFPHLDLTGICFTDLLLRPPFKVLPRVLRL